MNCKKCYPLASQLPHLYLWLFFNIANVFFFFWNFSELYLKNGETHDEDKRKEAVYLVKTKQLSISKASQIYNITYATIHNIINKKIKSTKIGSSTAISWTEEKWSYRMVYFKLMNLD